MHKRTLYALFVFVVLGFAASWVLRASPERGITRLDLRHIATERADALELVHQGRTTRLSLHDNVWTVGEDGPADPDAVAAALAAVSRISTSDYITNDESRFGELGVEGEASTQVTLYAASAPLARFFLNTGADGAQLEPSKQLIRHEGQVFRLDSLDTGSFTRDANDWQDRAVTRDLVDAVASVSYAPAQGEGYTLNQVDGSWALAEGTHLPDNYRYDPNLARFYVNSLLNLRAQQVVQQDPGASVTKLDVKQADQIHWRLRPGAEKAGSASERTLLLGAAKDDQTLYAQVVGQPRILLVNRPQGESLKKPLTEFRALNMMDGPKFEDVVAATIRTADKKTLSFTRDSDGQWAVDAKVSLPKGFELDQNKLRARLRQALLARAVGIAKQQPGAARRVDAAFGQVALMTADKKVHALTFGPQAKDKAGVTHLATGTADKQTYLTSQALRDALLGGLATLSTQGPAANAGQSPQSLEGLPPELRRQIQQQLAKP